MRAKDRRKGSDVTVHGFRSSFRGWAAERFPLSARRLRSRTRQGQDTERAYQRGDLFDKRRGPNEKLV
jgi:hypothetical protein